MTRISDRRVYVVNERCPVQRRLQNCLRKYHILAEWFATTQECLKALFERSCGLLVIGINGEPETAIQLLMQSNQMYPRMSSVAVVDKGDVDMAVKAVKAGASDCAQRPLSEEWWLTTLETVVKEPSTGRVRSNGTLTETEKLILREVVKGRTSREIGRVLHRSPRTVEVHRAHILRKLGVSSTVDLVRQSVIMDILDPVEKGHKGVSCGASRRTLTSGDGVTDVVGSTAR
jgi:FixJ family two-component response regulator